MCFFSREWGGLWGGRPYVFYVKQWCDITECTTHCVVVWCVVVSHSVIYQNVVTRCVLLHLGGTKWHRKTPSVY